MLRMTMKKVTKKKRYHHLRNAPPFNLRAPTPQLPSDVVAFEPAEEEGNGRSHGFAEEEQKKGGEKQDKKEKKKHLERNEQRIPAFL